MPFRSYFMLYNDHPTIINLQNKPISQFHIHWARGLRALVSLPFIVIVTSDFCPVPFEGFQSKHIVNNRLIARTSGKLWTTDQGNVRQTLNERQAMNNSLTMRTPVHQKRLTARLTAHRQLANNKSQWLSMAGQLQDKMAINRRSTTGTTDHGWQTNRETNWLSTASQSQDQISINGRPTVRANVNRQQVNQKQDWPLTVS